MGRISLHETFERLDETHSSDRSFGLIFAALASAIALWPVLRGDALRWWLIGLAVLLAAVGLVVPKLLHPLNRAWMWVGRCLNRIVNPVLLGLVFFGVLTPLGLAMRATGRDPLRLRFDRSARSYWILRDPPGPDPKSMIRQF